jgi:hypothetical protein
MNTSYVYKRDCGICYGDLDSKDNAYWESPTSPYVHAKCANEIKNCEKKLIKTINHFFTQDQDRKLAHINAVRAVVNEIERLTGTRFVSLRDYFLSPGEEALKRLFDTVGVDAVKMGFSTTPLSKL